MRALKNSLLDYIFFLKLNSIRMWCKTLVLHPPISIRHIIIFLLYHTQSILTYTHQKSKLSNANSYPGSLLRPLLQPAVAHPAIFIDGEFLGHIKTIMASQERKSQIWDQKALLIPISQKMQHTLTIPTKNPLIPYLL